MPTKPSSETKLSSKARLNSWLLIIVLVNLLISIATICNQFIFKEKLVYVDAIKLVTNYKGMELAKKELEGKAQTWNANLDTLRKEFEESVTRYERTKNSLSAKEKQLTEELLKTKQEQYLNYQDFVKTNYEKTDQEYSSKILSKVNDYIKRYGEEHGYTIIFAATQYGNIAYANTEHDITEELLKGLNEEYQLAAK